MAQQEIPILVSKSKILLTHKINQITKSSEKQKALERLNNSIDRICMQCDVLTVLIK